VSAFSTEDKISYLMTNFKKKAENEAPTIDFKKQDVIDLEAPKPNPALISSTTKLKKRFKKEAHSLKLAYLSRTSESCPSEISDLSLPKRRPSYQKPRSNNQTPTKKQPSRASSFSSMVKLEASELTDFRKKECWKIYELMLKDFVSDKKKAKMVTINMEHKINQVFSSVHSKKSYIRVVKTIFKKLKVV